MRWRSGRRSFSDIFHSLLMLLPKQPTALKGSERGDPFAKAAALGLVVPVQALVCSQYTAYGEVRGEIWLSAHLCAAQPELYAMVAVGSD